MTPRFDARVWRGALALLAIGLSLGSAYALAPTALAAFENSVQAWQSLPAPEQQALQTKIQGWDALPAAQRREQRARYQAWLALEEVDRARLRAAARQYAELPATEQARLRVVFEHQDAMSQQGWRLGPDLGADWPRLQPLFGFVPPEQRAALLVALKQTDARQRDDLAALAQRIPPQSREGFRREWLQQPAAQRGEWLQQRRNQ